MNNKYSLYPIANQNLWDLYKKHQDCLWPREKVSLANDIKDYRSLKKEEQYFILHLLGFFAQSDGIVNENLCANFYKEVELPAARAFYSVQIYQETVHAEMYAEMIEAYADASEKDKLFNAIDNFPAVGAKAKWAKKWLDPSSASFAKRLIAFSIVEGIFFSGAFCAIFWIRDRGLLPGLSLANNYIARDEGMHYDFAVELFKTLKLSISEPEFKEMISEAVSIEKQFITESLPVALIGMNNNLMSQYIEFVADGVCRDYGFSKIYDTENPFPFMQNLGMEKKANFFERDSDNYRIAKSEEFGIVDDF